MRQQRWGLNVNNFICSHRLVKPGKAVSHELLGMSVKLQEAKSLAEVVQPARRLGPWLHSHEPSRTLAHQGTPDAHFNAKVPEILLVIPPHFPSRGRYTYAEPSQQQRRLGPPCEPLPRPRGTVRPAPSSCLLRNRLPSLGTLAPFPGPLQNRPRSHLTLALSRDRYLGQCASSLDFWVWKPRIQVRPVREPAIYQTWEFLAAVFLHVEETGMQREVGTTTERDTDVSGAENVLVTFTADAEAALETRKVFFLPEEPDAGLR